LAFADGDHFKSLISFSIQEEIKCDQELSLIKSAFKVRKEDRVTCSDVNWINNHLERVRSISPIAPKVNFELYAISNGASFDIGHTISIPLTLTFSNQWGETYYGSPFAISPIIYHEYAHAIFTNLLADQFYPSLRKQAKALSKLKVDIQKIYATGNPGGLAQVYEKRIKVLSKTIKNNKDFKQYEMTTSYNEFFADLVAVLITNNKDTITNALYYPQMNSKRYETIKLRSFSNHNTHYSNRNLHEKHGELAIARQFVGTQYLKEVFESNDRKRKFLTNILAAIKNIITLRIKNKDFSLNPKKNNLEFIEEIKRVMNTN
jgi:hypothetical protein